MMHYCDFAPDHPVHGPYHNHEYGFPLQDDNALLERLALEIMQAGLSWEIVLKKRQNLVEAFHGFDIAKVAIMEEGDVERLLGNPGIIRNRLKINSIIHNAKALKAWQEEGRGFAQWLVENHPKSLKKWIKTFKSVFRFTGHEICKEFLMSIGYLPGAHRPDCLVFQAIKAQNPPWSQHREFAYYDD